MPNAWSRRRWGALWLTVALLLLQWSALSHACPLAAAPMADCAGMTAIDDASPPDCKAHCEHGRQGVNTAPAPDLPPGAPWPGAPWDAAAAPPPLTLRVRPQPPPPDSAPPLYLAFLVLRR